MGLLGQKQKVLIIDDSDIIRHALKIFFEDYDFKVLASLDGLDGVKKAAEHKPSLIILDLIMPNFDGVKVLQVLKVLDNLKDIPVLVITANTDRKNILAAVEAGADKVLSKPLQKEVLVKTVNELLGSEIISKARKNKKLSKVEEKELKEDLLQFFMKHFPEKKKNIERALRNKNKEELKILMHELKGNGGMIGLSKVSDISGELEKKLSLPDIDWRYIQLKIEQIFSITSSMEKTIEV
jgi:DNA-binding response OmpR family regulator